MITNFIVDFCVTNKDILVNLIYTLIIIIIIIILGFSIKLIMRIKNVKKLIDLVNEINASADISSDSEDYEVIKLIRDAKIKDLEAISKNFPIMVNEVKDVYNKKKPKQISAIDLFENNLIIPSHDEIIIRNMINSLTSLGLLGTFVGLIASIKGIDVQQTAEGIEALVSSLSPAITTTLIGVIASLLSSLMLTFVKRKYKKLAFHLAEKMMLDKPNDTNPDYFYDSFTTFTGEKYEKALSNIVDNFLVQMKQGLTKDLDGYSKVIVDATNNLATSEERFTNAASGLESTVDNINKHLKETEDLNKNFENTLKIFTTALDNFNDKFKASMEATDSILNNVESINSNNIKLNQSLLDNLNSELEEIKTAFEIIKEMNFDFKKVMMDTPLQLNQSITNLCNNIMLLSNNVDTKVNGSLKQFSNSLIQFKNELSQVIGNDGE